jgi:glycosyltransferase involved in cell wall biosynthesis
MGGIERASSTLANQFARRGHEVHFVKIFPFADFYEIDSSIKIYTPQKQFLKKEFSKFGNILYYWNVLNPFYGSILKIVKRINPDAILSFGDWFPHLVMLGLRNQFPFYYGNRSNPNIKYPYYFELIRKAAYKISPPSGVIAQTNRAKERKQRLLGDEANIRIIPNPAPVISQSFEKRENWIISTGRLHKEKGFIRLIEIFSKLQNKNDWKLIIVGDGIHAREIKEKVKELDLEQYVIFTGKVKNVFELLAKSKIFVLASHNEGFPNALLEAAAAGLACLSFDIVAGPSDIISNGMNGILIPDNDLIAMTDALQMLISNQDEIDRLGVAAKKSMERFNIEKITDEYLSFIIK